ncbi:MAG: hypothetical protein AAF810_05405 [Cyanobacteria bacterium P01_D01_bin.36]
MNYVIELEDGTVVIHSGDNPPDGTVVWADTELVPEKYQKLVEKPSKFNPDAVWALFLNSDIYLRLNAIANQEFQVQSKMWNLAFAWKASRADKDFWTTRVSLAIQGLDSTLTTTSNQPISDSVEEKSIFEAWNSDHELGLTFHWQ